MSIADAADNHLEDLEAELSEESQSADDEPCRNNEPIVESTLTNAANDRDDGENVETQIADMPIETSIVDSDTAVGDTANGDTADGDTADSAADVSVNSELVDGDAGETHGIDETNRFDADATSSTAEASLETDARRPPRLKPIKSVKRGFAALNLRSEVLQAILESGYDKPFAIQRQTIPHVLAGSDLLGQAETGSGKTAAFACPLLSMIDLDRAQPQVLVLTPTRELALQVTEAIERYAAHLPGFRAATIYGGQSYDIQLRQLKRGVHIVVGTPGRVMDHMRRNTLKLHSVKCLVLDEADEMLRMGFVDDVEWILTMTPQDRQILLFSATLPEPIRRIADQHLKDPQQVTVKGRNITADSIRQRYLVTSPREKTDMVTRILESETTDGVIVFVRTRGQTVEVAEKLAELGYSAAPLNGDMPQSHRERTVENFRTSKLAVLVATDVAARGLDVDRVSHVINYDFPHDVEAYVHRIGRTGRAGRSGQAILFVGHREKGRLSRVESGTNQQLEMMPKPSIQSINAKRIDRFKQQIVEAAAGADLRYFADLVAEVQTETELSPLQIAAALAKLAQGDVPLLMKEQPHRERSHRRDREGFEDRGPGRRDQTEREFRDKGPQGERGRKDERGFQRRGSKSPAAGMQRYRIDVGRAHGVGPKNIVGAIANESGIDSTSIGRIEIHDLHSTIDLPDGLTGDFFRSLKGVRVGGQQLRLTKEEATRFSKPGEKKDFGKRKFKKPAGAKTTNKTKFSAKDKFPGKSKSKSKTPLRNKAKKRQAK